MNSTSLCLVCVFDGLRPDMVRPDWTPSLWRLRERGVWFARSHCVFPSVTRVNSASLSTGSFPGTHGIEGNAVWRPAIEPGRRLDMAAVADVQRLRTPGGRVLRVPTMGEVLAGHGLRAVALGTGSSGGAFLQHPEAAATDGLLFHHQFAVPDSLAEAVEGYVGLPRTEGDYAALALARVDYAARALTDVLVPMARPALAAFWITVPDGLHHRHGLGSPEAIRAIGTADAVFGRMLDRLNASGLYEAIDVFVTADHGYATVTEHIDAEDELVRAGFKRSRDSTEVVVCPGGGSLLVYVEDGVDLGLLASFLLGRPWAGAVFSRGGSIPGTLPLAAIGCAGPNAPDLIVALRWSEEKNGHGVPGCSIGLGGIAVGAGDHGGISPFEMRNTLLAAGPHFRERVTSEVPCGIVDVAPTALHCLGLPAPDEWDGRVLAEALRDGPAAPEVAAEEHSVVFPGGRQVLRTMRAGQVVYVGEAGIIRG